MERKLAKVLGINVDLFTSNEALAYVHEKIQADKPCHIITINPEMVQIADEQRFVKLIFDRADLVIPDGIGIKMALSVQGVSQEKIPGIVFAQKLLELCAQNGYKTAFIGAQQDVLDEAVANMQDRYQGLQVSYKQNGFFNKGEQARIFSALKQAAPKVVFVALGAPRQEIFIAACMEQINSAVFIGVGGSFDVWANRVERAPKIFQDLNLEWLYRVIKQPSRFSRVFPTLPIFLIKVIFNASKDKLDANK